MNRRSTLQSLLKAVALIAVVAILPLVAGYFAALYVVPTPKIAVIRVEGDIWGLYTAYLSQAMDRAVHDPAVRAVVLDISSPGGEVTASESLYYDVLKLREAKPVLASVDEIAASGAYYTACAADQIYAKPASLVGNVGVISLRPEPDLVDEILLTTGPFKLSGTTQMGYVRELEMLKDIFLEAIWSQRAERLQMTPEELSRGEIYHGSEAQRLGLIDEIGSLADAAAAAASLARVRNYRVVDFSPELPEEEVFFGFKADGRSTAVTIAAPPQHLPAGLYYRYIEPSQ